MEEENKKMISLTKRGFWWYTLFSFLLVTFLIFTAVMITHSATVKSVGSTYAEKLALATQGVTKQQVQELSTVQTYHNGDNVFEVSYKKDGEKHIVYICAESAEIQKQEIAPKNEPTPAQNDPMPENPMPEMPGMPMPENPMEQGKPDPLNGSLARNFSNSLHEKANR